MVDILQHVVVGEGEVLDVDVFADVTLFTQDPLSKLTLKVENRLPVNVLVVVGTVDLNCDLLAHHDVHKEVFNYIRIFFTRDFCNYLCPAYQSQFIRYIMLTNALIVC